MASNRHLGRIVALQTLYEYDFRTFSGDDEASIDEITHRNIERYKETVEDTDFIEALVNGVIASTDALDDIIRPIAPEWPVEQIARIDKAILRMALFELTEMSDVPPKVTINEAVELAKAFGGDNSSRFVNGVLGTAYRNITDGEAQTEAKDAKKPAKKPVKKPAAKKKTTKKTVAKKKPAKKSDKIEKAT